MKSVITHDYRKKYRETYLPKTEQITIQQQPELTCVSQRMIISYNMDWNGRPEPIDEKWLAFHYTSKKKNSGQSHPLMTLPNNPSTF
ncbi:hypothetical protein KGF86_07220 [Ornithinibacillus massiliensis]|uniref:Uncharacterized protein n=1 Tax=Ornithinibacillus massiliensis TaxID=1944633 RepID=A0ABS5MCF7_9BACI|nr:hypothetical protein [Ornithinibacillus massiliensis]MBS3679999.1 hypothetical protein [Ornithinibacillus massiliensis]